MPLAITGYDIFIVGMMTVVILAGLLAIARATLYAVKAGAALSAACICVGFAYFGWYPLFGGQYGFDVYFGCALLFLGLLAAALLAAVEETYRRLTGHARSRDRRAAFPVVLPSAAEEDPDGDRP
jgi:hypothetical protein